MMDTDTFTQEVLRAEKSLYYTARLLLHNDEDCADAMQSAILKAYENLRTLKKESYFRTWLTRILINECYNILRERRDTIPYEEYMTEYEQLSDPPEEAGVLDELDQLPEKYRLPIVLHDINGFSTSEVAEMLNMNTASVRMRLSRGRGMLKKRLEENG